MNIHKDNRKLAAELAEALVEDRMGKHMAWEDREDGSEGLTEEAQDVFNDIYDIILTNLESI
jgi:DNA replication initiation complex subunit (GINS family)